MSTDDKIEAYKRRKDERRKKLLENDIVERWRKRRADRRARYDAKWITIGATPPDERRGEPGHKGRHVLIDDEGKIISGAGGSMTGVELKGAKSSGEDVKVDPGKTSDPKPTSPAGAEGKSAGEVATEAKAKEGEGTSGAETVSKGGEPTKTEGEYDAIKSAFESSDWDKVESELKMMPNGTEMHYSLGGDESVLTKKGDYWLGSESGVYFKSSDLVTPYKGLAFVSPTTGEWVDVVGDLTGYSKSEEKPKAKYDPEAAKKALGAWDIKAWNEWLESAPSGTTLKFDDQFGVDYYQKNYDGKWIDGATGEVVKIEDLGFDDESLETFLKGGGGLYVVDPETGKETELIQKTVTSGGETGGEEPTEPKGKSDEEFYSTAGDTFKAAMDDKGKLKGWMDSAPAGTWAVAQNEDGESFLSCQKTLDGKWLVTNTDGDTSKVDAEKAAEMLADNLEHFEEWYVTKGFGELVASGKTGKGGEEPTGGETAGGTPKGGESGGWSEPKGFGEATKSESALKDWMSGALDGTEIRLENDDTEGVTFTKEADGTWKVQSDDPDEEEQTYDSPEEAVKALLEGMGAFGNYKVTHGWSGETATGTYTPGEATEGGETPTGSGGIPEAEEEPDKPYVEKDDFGSVLTSKNSDAIKEKLNGLKDGAVIQYKDGSHIYRMTKNDDGTWKREAHWTGSADADSWHDYGNVSTTNVTNGLKAASGEVDIDGEKVKTFGHRHNQALALAKKGEKYGIEALGLDKPDYAAYFVNEKGDEYQVLKQPDGTFLINDGKSAKKISQDNLLKKIRNNDLWFSHVFAEEGYNAKVNEMLKKHLAPLKSSLVKTDTGKFQETLDAIENHSSFQLRNTDGSGLAVRKVRDWNGSEWQNGYAVKEIDKDGNVLKTEHFTDSNLEALYDKLASKTSKSTVFSNEKDIKPYVAPVKKSKYTGPKDGTSHASESKTAGGLTKVSYGDEAFSDGARAAAIDLPATSAGVEKMHEKLFPKMKTWWKSLSDSQREYAKQYTGSYHDTNEPLRGFKYTDTSGWKDADHINKKIKAIESALDKSTLDEPIVLTRGLSARSFNAMLQKKSAAYSDYASYKTPSSYGDELIGKELTDPSFLSCTGVGKAGFGSKPVQLRIFAPAGTKACYAHPFSEYGMMKSGPDLSGGTSSPYTGCEYEVILQRGSKFRIKGVTKKGGQLFLDVDLVEQNPRDMKVVGNKCVYSDGKDAYDF